MDRLGFRAFLHAPLIDFNTAVAKERHGNVIILYSFFFFFFFFKGTLSDDVK